MKNDTFNRFIYFGAIGDKKAREHIASSIYSQLQNKAENASDLTNADSDNFATSINEILSNPTMKELCSKDDELAEKITFEVLNFINNTKKR